MTVVAVLALAVVGTGAAFAYRTYVGSPRSGEPPIIKADNSPTKVVPAPSAMRAAKTPDRMVTGDGGEKIVPREEAPVDVNAKSGPRVVFPPLNQNGNPPPVASVSPAAPPPATAGNGTLPNNEPRKIKTLAVKGDQPTNGGVRRRRLRRPDRPRKPAPAPAAAAAGCAAQPAIAPTPAPMRRCRWRRRAAPRRRSRADPGGRHQSGRRPRPRQRRRLPGSGLLAEERGRRAGLLPGAAGQIPGGAGLASRR